MVCNLQFYIIKKIYILFRIIKELKWVAWRLSLDRDFSFFYTTKVTNVNNQTSDSF